MQENLLTLCWLALAQQKRSYVYMLDALTLTWLCRGAGTYVYILEISIVDGCMYTCTHM